MGRPRNYKAEQGEYEEVEETVIDDDELDDEDDDDEDDDEDEESEDEGEDEEVVKPKKKPTRKKAATTTTKRRTAAKGREKAIWVILDNSGKLVEEFAFNQKAEAEAKLEKVRVEKQKGTFYLQLQKVKMEG